MMESPTLELFIIIKSLALFWGRGMERRNFTVIIVKWWNKHAWTERRNQVNFQTIGIIRDPSAEGTGRKGASYLD